MYIEPRKGEGKVPDTSKVSPQVRIVLALLSFTRKRGGGGGGK